MDVYKGEIFGRSGIKLFKDRPATIGELFAKTVNAFGDKVAIISEEQQLTYSQLDAQSNLLVANLQQKLNVQKGDRIATIVGNSVEFALITIACMKVGAIMVPINVKLSTDEMDYILNHSKPSLLIYENEFQEKIMATYDYEINEQAKCHRFEIGGSNRFTELIDEGASACEQTIEEEDSAFILYTSGTTGKPKGAVLSHINVVHSVMNYADVLQTDATISTAIAVPMFHVTGLVGQLLHMFYIGGTVYSLRRYQNEDYIRRIVEHRINFLFNVPTIFIMMFTSDEFRKYSFDFVKKVAFGGSPIYQQTFDLLRQAFPNATLHNAYGATETTSPTTLMPVDYEESKLTSVGRAVKVAEIKVMNEDGEECQPGEKGELYIKGPMVVKEYWENPTANLTSFSNGFWKSGDIGTVDKDGFYYIHDRMKDMINRAGEKIFSIEVEDALKRHPLIVEAAVIGVPDPIFGEKVKAFVVGPELTEVHFTELKAHCLQLVAKFKVPEEFEILKTLPRNASGKILKASLKNIGGRNHV